MLHAQFITAAGAKKFVLSTYFLNQTCVFHCSLWSSRGREGECHISSVGNVWWSKLQPHCHPAENQLTEQMSSAVVTFLILPGAACISISPPVPMRASKILTWCSGFTSALPTQTNWGHIMKHTWRTQSFLDHLFIRLCKSFTHSTSKMTPGCLTDLDSDQMIKSETSTLFFTWTHGCISAHVQVSESSVAPQSFYSEQQDDWCEAENKRPWWCGNSRAADK